MSVKENQTDIIKVLTNKRSLRALLKTLTINQINDIQEKVLEVSSDLIDQEKARQEEIKNRNSAMDGFLDQLIQQGFSLSEIAERVNKKV